MQQGIRYFERAIQRDPGYALAYASIAMACAELAETGLLPPDDAYRRARVAGATALALDACLAEAHVVNGQLKALCDFDWTGAEQDFQRALELSPSNADAWDLYGRMCAALARHDEAVAMEKRAQALDPLAHRTDLATALLRAGRSTRHWKRPATRSSLTRTTTGRSHPRLGLAEDRTGGRGFAELEQAVARHRAAPPGSPSWEKRPQWRAGRRKRARCSRNWKRCPASGTSRPITWHTSLRAWAKSTARSTASSSRTGSGRCGVRHQGLVPVRTAAHAPQVPGAARAHEPGSADTPPPLSVMPA
jgi:hypothetical protein